MSDPRGIEPPADDAHPESPADDAARPERRVLVDEVMTEIASWTLRARIRAFKRWHAGAFSIIHLNVLSLLESEPALSMTRLADTLDVSVASTTGIVDRMEKRGLVARLHDLGDRRVVLVQSTELGRAVCSELDADARERIGRLIGELSDEELAGFLLGIRGLRSAHARLFGAGDAAGPAGEGHAAADDAPGTETTRYSRAGTAATVLAVAVDPATKLAAVTVRSTGT